MVQKIYCPPPGSNQYSHTDQIFCNTNVYEVLRIQGGCSGHCSQLAGVLGSKIYVYIYSFLHLFIT